jgi:hypothetical protein
VVDGLGGPYSTQVVDGLFHIASFIRPIKDAKVNHLGWCFFGSVFRDDLRGLRPSKVDRPITRELAFPEDALKDRSMNFPIP